MTTDETTTRVREIAAPAIASVLATMPATTTAGRAVARRTDPATSHEAAATVDLSRSQQAVYAFITGYVNYPFTDRQLVRAYNAIPLWVGLPPLSDSRIRTARLELATRGMLACTGTTDPDRGRRERLWELPA